MTIINCPHCQKVISYDEHTGDFVHECDSGNEIFDQDDEVIMTTSITETDGTSTSTGKLQGDINYQGISNTLAGTRAAREGGKTTGYTRRGANSQTHRQTQHEEYIKTGERK